MWLVYRRRRKDLFMLTVGVAASLVLLVGGLLVTLRWNSFIDNALLIGVILIAFSALAGGWLRRVAKEDQEQEDAA
jgi:uncharacterized membrane protein